MPDPIPIKMGKLHKFLKLKPRDRQLIVFTFILLSLIRLGFLLFRFPKLQQLLTKLSQPQHNQPHSIMAIIWAVNAASAVTPGGVKCLARALATEVMMRRQGYYPTLRIGVIKNLEGQPQFHAWLEYQGQVIMGQLPNLQDFNLLLPMQPNYPSVR